jgi:hypothetical protein
MVEGDEEVASALRELISAVVIHPAGKDEPKIEVTAAWRNSPGRPICSHNRRFGQRW